MSVSANGSLKRKRNGDDHIKMSHQQQHEAKAATATATPIDLQSQYGQFCWEQFDGKYLPVLFRGKRSYCAADMVQQMIVEKYQSKLNPELFGFCKFIGVLPLTPREAQLLNEINHKHCDGLYGPKSYTATRDHLVSVDDVRALRDYLAICHRMSVERTEEASPRCGYISIDRNFIVPFTLHENGERYMPQFFFEGENLDTNVDTEQIGGWPLAYLRLCCFAQGISDKFYKTDTVDVISYRKIKEYFPPGTHFEVVKAQQVIETVVLTFDRREVKPFGWLNRPTAASTAVPIGRPLVAQRPSQHQHQHLLQRQRAIAAAASAQYAHRPVSNNGEINGHAQQRQPQAPSAPQQHA